MNTCMHVPTYMHIHTYIYIYIYIYICTYIFAFTKVQMNKWILIYGITITCINVRMTWITHIRNHTYIHILRQRLTKSSKNDGMDNHMHVCVYIIMYIHTYRKCIMVA
jgi:hypothetical protein